MAMCPACQKRIQICKYGKASLYLDHVTEVVQYIRDNYPYLKVIIWDDMLRNIELNVLQGEIYTCRNIVTMVQHFLPCKSHKYFLIAPSFCKLSLDLHLQLKNSSQLQNFIHLT